MSFSVPGNSLGEAETQQKSAWNSLPILSPTRSDAQQGQLSPESCKSNSLCVLPEGLGCSVFIQKSVVREQIIITHIVCMQHSEELGIGDELHSWRLQQQGDFLRIHRRKGTFPPDL